MRVTLIVYVAKMGHPYLCVKHVRLKRGHATLAVRIVYHPPRLAWSDRVAMVPSFVAGRITDTDAVSEGRGIAGTGSHRGAV